MSKLTQTGNSKSKTEFLCGVFLIFVTIQSCKNPLKYSTYDITKTDIFCDKRKSKKRSVLIYSVCKFFYYSDDIRKTVVNSVN
jgi:hypothetical protein